MLDFQELVIDFTHVRPVTTCVDFQDAAVQKLGKKYSKDGLKFEAISSGDLSIVEIPAPPNAFAWVPPLVKYLFNSDDALLMVTFPAPVNWVEVSVAKVSTPASNYPSLCLIGSYVRNAKGWQSGVKDAPLADPFGLVRSYDFSSRELVIPPHGEFERAPKPVEIGPITELFVNSTAFHVWRICYF